MNKICGRQIETLFINKFKAKYRKLDQYLQAIHTKQTVLYENRYLKSKKNSSDVETTHDKLE